MNIPVLGVSRNFGYLFDRYIRYRGFVAGLGVYGTLGTDAFWVSIVTLGTDAFWVSIGTLGTVVIV